MSTYAFPPCPSPVSAATAAEAMSYSSTGAPGLLPIQSRTEEFSRTVLIHHEVFAWNGPGRRNVVATPEAVIASSAARCSSLMPCGSGCSTLADDSSTMCSVPAPGRGLRHVAGLPGHIARQHHQRPGDALEGGGQRGGVGGAARDDLHALRQAGLLGAAAERTDPAAEAHQLFHGLPAHLAGRSGDQNHRQSLQPFGSGHGEPSCR